MTDQLLEKFENKILTLTINRPDALNALNKPIMDRLYEIFVDEDAAYAEARVVVITGSGTKAFAAGADIKEFPNLGEEQSRSLSQRGHRIFDAIEQGRRPVIAAINGYCLGGGNELSMACHLRIGEAHARFGQPEVNLGLIPGYGGTVRLPRLIGQTKASYYLFTGEQFNAEQAKDWGLLNEVVESGKGLDRAMEIAINIVGKAPLALRKMITIMRNQWEMKAQEMEVEYFCQSFGTEDMKEGLSAFDDKRKPNFRGI